MKPRMIGCLQMMNWINIYRKLRRQNKMKYYNKFLAGFLILVIILLTVNAAVEYKRITNLRVRGWLFADEDTWVGWHTISASGTADSFYVAGADTSDYVFATLRTDSIKVPLTARVFKTDSVVISCAAKLTANTDKVNYLIIKD
jgi:hypothetical protein